MIYTVDILLRVAGSGVAFRVGRRNLRREECNARTNPARLVAAPLLAGGLYTFSRFAHLVLYVARFVENLNGLVADASAGSRPSGRTSTRLMEGF